MNLAKTPLFFRARHRNEIDVFSAKLRLDLLFRRSLFAHVAVLSNATLLLIFGMKSQSAFSLPLWVGITFFLVALRSVLHFFWHRQRKHLHRIEEVERWFFLFATGVFLSGVLWGILGWYYFELSSSQDQTVVIFLLAGMSAGAVGAYSASLRTLYCFLIPALSPLTLRSFFMGNEAFVFMALVMVLYIVLMLLLGYNSRKTFSESLEMIRKNETLEIQRDEAHRFLAATSHEVRTPLSVIIGYVDILLRSTSLVPQQEKYLSTIQRNAHYLLALMNDLLNISKIQTKNLNSSPEKFSPAQEIHAIVESMSPQLSSSVTLQVRIDPGVPETWTSYPQVFRQVLLNLLSNAQKFTREGKILIEASCQSNAQDSFLCVQVKDTGVGIEPAMVRILFQAFSRSRSEFIQSQKGSGLGLKLSRDLCRSLGGDLTLIETEVGKGSTFEFQLLSLPSNTEVLAPPDRASALTRIQKDLAQEDLLSHVTVLIVEEFEIIFQRAHRLLHPYGCQIEKTNKDVDALVKVFAKDYDLILLPLDSQKIQSFQLSEQLRRRGFLKPILAFTSHSTLELEQKGFNAGLSGFLKDSLAEDELLKTILAHLRRSI